MFVGGLFYKDKKGEIKELTIEFLYNKIKEYYSNRNLEKDDIDNLLSVLTLYIQTKKEDNLIEEKEIDLLLKKIKREKAEKSFYIDDRKHTYGYFKNFLKEKKAKLPKNIEKKIFGDIEKFLENIKNSLGIINIKKATYKNLVYDILDGYNIDYKKSKMLSFPLDELLLIYSKYSPFEAGEYFKEVVNLYIFRNFLYHSKLKKMEERKLIKVENLDPFEVDMLDLVSKKADVGKKEMQLAKNIIFYKKKLFDKCDIDNKYLFQINKNQFDVPSIVYIDDFIEYKNNIKSFAFRKNENYSLFSMDETIFPVYSSIYNVELNIDRFKDYPSSRQFEEIEKLVKYIRKFYYKYNEYFYLINLLKRRNLYIKIFIDISNSDYNHFFTSYIRKLLDKEDMIKIVLFNRNKKIKKTEYANYAKENYLIQLNIDSEDWDENMFKYCRRNNIYLLNLN
ncbi:MAG: hypothetical protein FXF47_01495 [Candidatus Mcinerneyibacterium aminivorans]|uniref:Uncharacterized protein n=1 Tax=Candidatus Mcinerneyibacterium aminivorans TaxID=2703815 RepID=A0A5D0MKG2_9BACT|nr:MAG: hypothetical protein FXF47_01495 [Candidatus Mcinerneyibacterium aminivorans]